MKLKAAEDSAKRLTRGSKACREKSAEVIVCFETSLHEVKKTPCGDKFLKLMKVIFVYHK